MSQRRLFKWATEADLRAYLSDKEFDDYVMGFTDSRGNQLIGLNNKGVGCGLLLCETFARAKDTEKILKEYMKDRS